MITAASQVSAASVVERIEIGKVSKVTIDAFNPWAETIANPRASDLDQTFANPQDPRVTIVTTDDLQIDRVLKILGATAFNPTKEHDGDLWLCYRLTFEGRAGAIVLYADARGNVLKDGRVLRVTRKAQWLADAWDAIVRRTQGSYAPVR